MSFEAVFPENISGNLCHVYSFYIQAVFDLILNIIHPDTVLSDCWLLHDAHDLWILTSTGESD